MCTYIRLIHPEAFIDKRLKTDNLGPVFQVQKHVFEIVVKTRRKDFIIDELPYQLIPPDP